jgi:TonB family protein
MRNREPHIPLFLWVATAALAHILWGGGADRIAEVFEDQTSLARLAASVRRHVDSSNRQLEVTLLEEFAEPAPAPAPSPDSDADETREERDELREQDAFEKSEQDDPRAALKTKDDPDSEKPKPETKQQQPDRTQEETEKPKLEEDKKAVPTEPAPPPPPVDVMRRVSVKQHVQDKDQADNPNAKYQGDDANHVVQETQSRVTSTDQDDPNPTPGLSHLGPDPKAGNANLNDIAQSESSPGDPDDAPSTSSKDGKDEAEQEVAKAQAPQNPVRAVFGEPAGGQQTSSPAGVAQAPKPAPGQKAQTEMEARQAVSEVLTAEGESATRVASAQEAQAARQGRTARRSIPMHKGGAAGGGAGPYGRLGLTPGGLNPNLTPLAALETIGSDQLHRERVADGERRRSTHRGSWQTVGLERWRSAIENYIPTAREGTTTALNTARVPFSTYLNQIHNRLHPIFADRFLASLDGLPGDHPANRSGISTNLEIVLDPADGRIVRMGVTKASGTTIFDVNALEAVQRASPFGAAPTAIVSPDGNVYLHWEFHREPNLACSTYFARPKMLRVAPKTAPPAIPLRPPATPEEHGSNQNRPPPEQSGG